MSVFSLSTSDAQLQVGGTRAAALGSERLDCRKQEAAGQLGGCGAVRHTWLWGTVGQSDRPGCEPSTDCLLVV